jgi:hypothetical protein
MANVHILIHVIYTIQLEQEGASIMILKQLEPCLFF